MFTRARQCCQWGLSGVILSAASGNQVKKAKRMRRRREKSVPGTAAIFSRIGQATRGKPKRESHKLRVSKSIVEQQKELLNAEAKNITRN